MFVKKLMFKTKSTFKTIISTLCYSLMAILTFVMASVILFYLTNFYYNVEGQSMEPNIYPESANYAGQGCYMEYFSKYTYGDIVVAKSPENVCVVKRVIAMGGDKIGYYLNPETSLYELLLVKSNTTNIQKINESYLTTNASLENPNEYLNKTQYSYDNFCDLHRTFQNLEYNYTNVLFLELEKDEIYLLGDNRSVSRDCSVYGPLRNGDVLGKVSLIVEKNEFHLFKILNYIYLS